MKPCTDAQAGGGRTGHMARGPLGLLGTSSKHLTRPLSHHLQSDTGQADRLDKKGPSKGREIW